jgi:hypothetical protein
MSDRLLSPKRIASRTIGSPNKRVTLDVNSDTEQRSFSKSAGEVIIKINDPCERTLKDIARRIHPGWRENAESGSSDSNDTATTIDNDGPLMLYDHFGRLLTPPSSEYHEANFEPCVPSMIIRGVDRDQKDTEFASLDGSAEDDTDEFGYLLSSKEYVELDVTVRVTRYNGWARLIDVSCTYGGVKVASAFGHLICRELIRDSFYESMDSLGKPVSDRVDELLDHHGYLRWPIKEYYLGQKAGQWNDALDTGSILQIDEVLVDDEWQSQPLGALMVTSLVDRAVKRDCCAKFAFVLPSTGCFWKVEETGIKAFDKSQSWAEQNHVRVFLGVGFTRVAETGWFVLEIADEDQDPGVELEEGESKQSEHTILISGVRKN